MAYTKIGFLTVVPAADFASATSDINALAPTQFSEDGPVGKHAGMQVLRDNGAADYDLMIALGPNPTSKWMLLEAGTQVTPS